MSKVPLDIGLALKIFKFEVLLTIQNHFLVNFFDVNILRVFKGSSLHQKQSLVIRFGDLFGLDPKIDFMEMMLLLLLSIVSNIPYLSLEFIYIFHCEIGKFKVISLKGNHRG